MENKELYNFDGEEVKEEFCPQGVTPGKARPGGLWQGTQKVTQGFES